jgi:hypothetical protein
MTIQINKIKFASSGEITINYDVVETGATKKSVTLTSSDEPLPSFIEALSSLLDDVIIFCGLDSDAWEEGFVSGVTLKDTDNGIGLVITAQCKIELPVCINTPYIKPDYIEEKLQSKLDRLIEGATKFINGERATKQLELLAPV